MRLTEDAKKILNHIFDAYLNEDEYRVVFTRPSSTISCEGDWRDARRLLNRLTKHTAISEGRILHMLEQESRKVTRE